MPNAVIIHCEDINNAKEKLGFKPYYTITENYNNDTGKYTYSTIPVYGFADDFTVNAVTGEVLNRRGYSVKEDSLEGYTDIDDRWYAEAVNYLVCVGYSIDGDEFKGNEALTYDAMTDLYDSLEITDEEITPDTVITRYDFGKRLVKAMGYEI